MIDVGSVSQRIAEFNSRNGNDAISVNDGWLLYSNGAMCEKNPMGVMAEPPSDPRQRCTLVVKYHKTQLGRAVTRFDDRKDALMRDPNAWAYEEKNLGELKALQRDVEERKKLLATAEQELEKVMPGYVPPEEAKRRAEASARVEGKESDFRTRVKAITV